MKAAEWVCFCFWVCKLYNKKYINSVLGLIREYCKLEQVFWAVVMTVVWQYLCWCLILMVTTQTFTKVMNVRLTVKALEDNLCFQCRHGESDSSCPLLVSFDYQLGVHATLNGDLSVTFSMYWCLLTFRVTQCTATRLCCLQWLSCPVLCCFFKSAEREGTSKIWVCSCTLNVQFCTRSAGEFPSICTTVVTKT